MTFSGLLEKTVFVAFLLAVLYVGGCAYNKSRIETAFSKVTIGISEHELYALLGTPDEFDGAERINSIYASKPCLSPCVKRVWYYNFFQPKGFEAWSFELSESKNVIHSYHWLSP